MVLDANSTPKLRIKKSNKIIAEIEPETVTCECPECSTIMSRNSSMKLEIKGYNDEFFYCSKCEMDWVRMMLKSVVTSKADEIDIT